MIYELKANLPYEVDHYKTMVFNKETVALSYITLSKNPAVKETHMAIVAVARKNGQPIHTFSSKVYSGVEYDFIHTLLDNQGTLTTEGYEFALDNFFIGEVPLRGLIEGPIEIGLPSEEIPVEEETPEEEIVEDPQPE